MSETGATAEQIEAAAERRYNFLMTGYTNRTHMTGMGKTWDIDAKRKRLIAEMTVHARYLVPPRYQIVPSGAVVLSEEEAESCAEACRYNATRWGSGPVYDHYRALAAKLSGGAS